MTRRLLNIDIRSYWMSGTGRGGGALLDATTRRDPQGVPVLPGRHIKGLLRDAVEKAEQLAWPGFDGLAETLFGERGLELDHPARPGCLRVSDGQLPREVGNWLGSEAGRDARERLFRTVHSTAIDPATGVALDHSLRGYEVVIPLALEAEIATVPGREAPSAWEQRLGEALSLVRHVGAHRHRGLGRATLTLEEAS